MVMENSLHRPSSSIRDTDTFYLVCYLDNLPASAILLLSISYRSQLRESTSTSVIVTLQRAGMC